MKILYLTASPTVVELPLEEGQDYPDEQEFEKLELWPEIDAITESLFEARSDNFADLEIVAEMRKGDLPKYMRTRAVDVLHYSGHGVKTGPNPDEKWSESSLLVHADFGAGEFMSADFIKKEVEGKGVDAMVLNCCWSQPIVDALSEVVPFVIGTTNRLPNDEAAEFTGKFYSALAGGATLGEACTAADPDCAERVERALEQMEAEADEAQEQPAGGGEETPDAPDIKPLYECHVRDRKTWDKVLLGNIESPAGKKLLELQGRIENLRQRISGLLMTDVVWMFIAFVIAFAGYVVLDDALAAAEARQALAAEVAEGGAAATQAEAGTEPNWVQRWADYHDAHLFGDFLDFVIDSMGKSEWLKFEPFAIMAVLISPSIGRLTAALWLFIIAPMARRIMPILGAQAGEKVAAIIGKDHLEAVDAWLGRIEA